MSVISRKTGEPPHKAHAHGPRNHSARTHSVHAHAASETRHLGNMRPRKWSAPKWSHAPSQTSRKAPVVSLASLVPSRDPRERFDPGPLDHNAFNAFGDRRNRSHGSRQGSCTDCTSGTGRRPHIRLLHRPVPCSPEGLMPTRSSAPRYSTSVKAQAAHNRPDRSQSDWQSDGQSEGQSEGQSALAQLARRSLKTKRIGPAQARELVNRSA